MATSGTFSAVWESNYWSSTSNTKWYHWQGKWSKSGTTITLSNQTLYMTFRNASYGSGITDSVSTTGGSAQTVTWPTFSSSTTSGAVSLSNSSFSVSGSSTSSTISCVISGEYTGSTTISYDAYYKAPATPTISSMTWSKTPSARLVVDYGTTSFGVPTSGTVHLYCDTSPTPTTQRASETSTGTNTMIITSPPGNTKFYSRAIAKNSQLSSGYSPTVSLITGPSEPKSIEVTNITPTSVTAEVSIGTQGSDDTMTLVTTVGDSSTSQHVVSGEVVSVTINELESSTEYTISTYLINSTGSSNSKTATFTTPDDNKFYGSVDGKAKKIKKLYGSVDGKAKKIKKLYGSVNGKTKKVWETGE